MTIKHLNELLSSICSTYNEQKRTLNLSLFKNDWEHSDSWKQEQLKLRKEKLRQEYVSKVLSLKQSIFDAGESIGLEIGKKKYPATTATSEALRMSGEMQLNSANLFLMQQHSDDNILKAIRDSLTIGRVDFAFTVLEGWRERLEMTDGLSMQTEETRKLLNELDAITTQFDRDGKLKQLQSDYNALPAIAQTTESFGKFLNLDSTAEFIPIERIRSMSEDEVGQNIESVNISLSVA